MCVCDIREQERCYGQVQKKDRKAGKGLKAQGMENPP